jgi:uncharacterized protein YukE
MTISLPGLLDADTAALRAVAQRWERLVAEIDETVEDLARGTRDLPHHWSGDAAEAAQRTNLRLQVQIGNAHRYCDAIAVAIRGFADELDECRRMLHGVVAEAAGRGVSIDLASGRVTSTLSGPAGVDAYQREIEEIVAQADDADRRATQVLERNGLGDWDLPDDRLPEVYPDVVLATANYSPEYRAQWWHAQHQLNRDRIIAEYPEVIGAGEGLPSAVRDQANRLLLRRHKDDLLARRDRLDTRQDGAGSRAVLDVDARLAEIDGVEHRLAAPGARLLGLDPPLVTHGDPRWDDYVPSR